jgi:hypothetical protein
MFNVTCTPGKDASAAYMQITSEIPALVIYTDPVNMAVQLPPFPGGDQVLARFCRELAREAGRLADALESGRAGSARGPVGGEGV